MKPTRYATAAAFRRSLEDRLLKMARDQRIDIIRLRRQLAFDRLLCRLFAEANSPWLLKGGYAMELRLAAARTTRDIDLAIRLGPNSKQEWDPGAIRASLQAAADADLHDHFIFLIGEANLDLDAAPYGGARFPVEAELDGRTFAKFHVDVSSGDVLREPYEYLHGHNWLAFAQISPGTFPAISQEEQFAEKLHAYTLPWSERQNTRVKDLVDLALLLRQGKLDPTRLQRSIHDTFNRRKTHPVPESFPLPPDNWNASFAELASECGLTPEITRHHQELEHFLAPLLAPEPPVE